MLAVAALGSCQPGAVGWVERVFGDCIYNARDIFGFVLGLASICCWLVAQMPQLYRNYKSQSAEALSPWFLAEWLLGDTFNLLGALLKGDQLPTVVITAQYFITVDAVMMVQYIYYISLQRRRERVAAARRHRHHRRGHAHRSGGGGGDREGCSPGAADSGAGPAAAGSSAAAAAPAVVGPGAPDGGAENAGSGGGGRAAGKRDVAFRPQRALACLGTLLVLSQLRLPDTGPSLGAQREGGGQRRLLLAGAAAVAAHVPAWACAAGTALGYCSSLLYLTSRLSQILRNHRRQSVEGLAISMFLCAVAANSCYGAAILVRSYTWPELRSSLPWLIGSLGTVALDLTIFAQARAYGGGAAKQHPSDEDEPLLAVP